jgi:hypothetical protein
MPSILRFMQVPLPDNVAQELDGVPFTGYVSVANLKIEMKKYKIDISWDVLKSSGSASILLATTNHFSSGGIDDYIEIKRINVDSGNTTISLRRYPSGFYKFLITIGGQNVNTWIIFCDK